MKKRKNLLLIIILFILSALIIKLYTRSYFSIGFDALDNNWTFARYFFMIYPYQIILMFIAFIGLLISIFIKNTLIQSNGRLLMTVVNYNFKIIIALLLLDSLSSIHTLLRINDFRAYLNISYLIFISASILTIIISGVFYRELLINFKRK